MHDRALIQRYRCLTCKINFSEASDHTCKYQKKPFLNQPIFEQLVSGTSQRRLAKLLRINKKTVVRKFVFTGKHAVQALTAMLRANINRLFRRTWNTTKKIVALEWHVALYCWYHNCYLIDY